MVCWSGCLQSTTGGTRPGQRKARLLLEVLHDRDTDVLLDVNRSERHRV